MGIEVKVDKGLVAEVVEKKCQLYAQLINETVKSPLSSECDIVWRLDGLPDDLRVESNVLATLCLCFHGAQSLDWSLEIEDILSIPAKGELAVEDGGLESIGEEFQLLNNAFGTIEPDPDDEDVFDVLRNFVRDELVRDVWHAYGVALSKRESDFCMPLFCVSDGTALLSEIELAAQMQIEEVMSAFEN